MPSFFPDPVILREVAVASNEVKSVFLWAIAYVQGHGIDSEIEFSSMPNEKVVKNGLRGACDQQILRVLDEKYFLHPRLYSSPAVGLPIGVVSKHRYKSVYQLADLWTTKVGVGHKGFVMKIIKELLKVSFTPNKVESAIRHIGDNKDSLDIRSPMFLKIFLESGGDFGKKATPRPQSATLRRLG